MLLPKCVYTCVQMCLMFFIVCGGLLFATESDSFVYSHAGYGDVVYADGEDCEWVIETEEEQVLEFEFLFFEIEDENDCAFDYVEVKNFPLFSFFFYYQA